MANKKVQDQEALTIFKALPIPAYLTRNAKNMRLFLLVLDTKRTFRVLNNEILVFWKYLFNPFIEF